jgi:hypothetical protein
MQGKMLMIRAFHSNWTVEEGSTGKEQRERRRTAGLNGGEVE